MQYQQRIQCDQRGSPHEAEALDRISEDKIARRNRQEFKVRLRRFISILAVDAAVPDSDDRLLDLVIGLLADKIGDALFLIIVHVFVQNRRASHKNNDQRKPNFFIHADDKKNSKSRQKKYRGGA